MKRILMCMICTALILFSAVIVVPRAVDAAEQPIPEELLFQVVMDPWLIADGIFAYQLQSQYYLPILALAEGFEFFVESDLERGRVSGWVVKEDNTFVIDTQRGEYIIRGKKKPLPPNTVLQSLEIDEFDFYVQLDFLNEIWPVTMQVDLSTLSIDVEPQEKLAFQSRFDRLERKDVTLIRAALNDEAGSKSFPYLSNEPQLIGKPILDLQSSYVYNAAQRTKNMTTTISGTQQLGKAIADYAATYAYNDKDGLERPASIRLRLEKEAEKGGDNNLWLGLRKVQGGDVSVRQRDLIDSSIGGRGVFVSSFGRDGGSEFDRITVEGTGPPGWEIELYNNNRIIEFGEVEPDGEYRFEDVVLNFGNNQIRIVLFGPQGQVREIVKNHSVGGKMLSPGDFRYSGGIIDADRAFILLENKPRTQPRGVAQTGFAAYGLNKKVTLFGSGTRLPTTFGDKEYVTVGAEISALGSLISLEGYNEINGGNALDVRFLTDLFGVKLNLRNSFFNHFDSPDNGTGSGSKSFEADYKATTNFSTALGSLGLRLDALHTERLNGSITTKIDTQQSLTRGGVRISNSTTSNLAKEVHTSSTGRIDATVRFNEWQFRGGLNYSIYPTEDLTSVQSELRYSTKDSFNAALNLNHNFTQSTSGGGMQLGYDFGKMLSTLDAAYAQGGGWTFTLRASSSIHPYNESGQYKLSSRNRRASSPVRAHVFLDRDLDGEFSPDVDEPLEGVRLRAGSAYSKVGTNEDGYVVYEAGSTRGPVNFTIDETTLEDPYFKPFMEGYSVQPRKGSMPLLPFPIIETGSIDGTAYYDDGEPIQGLTLELVNEAGEVVETVETATDGFYTFEFIAPGTYIVRADLSYGIDLPPETITISPDDLFIYGIDMELLEQEEESSAVVNELDVKKDGLAQDREHHDTAAEESSGDPAPMSNEGAYETFVGRVRIGEHPDKVRLVLDLSGTIKYQTSIIKGGKEIYIDMPDVAWNAIKHWRSRSSEMLKNIEVRGGIESFNTFALKSGGTRLHIIARDALQIKRSGVLAPDPRDGKGYRFYIDLVDE